MKKNYLLGVLGISALALMTSCDKQEFANIDKAPETINGKGITFQIAENLGTKGEFQPFDPTAGGQFGSAWYSDYDRIGIIFDNPASVVSLHADAPLKIGTSSWYARAINGTPTESVVNQFKASASGNKGYFVASCDDDVLKYAAIGNVKFRAFWSPTPTGKTWNDVFTLTGNVVDGKVLMPTLNDQVQLNAEGHGIAEKGFMYSQTEKTIAESDINFDNSISKDRLLLSFNHAHPFLYFKIKSTEDETNSRYIDKYGQEFERYGKLESVKMESKGSDSPAVNKSILDYGNASFNMIAATLGADAITVDATTANLKSDITVKMGAAGAGLDWSNDYYAFMAINNIDRTKYRDDVATDALEITYVFKNITLKKEASTNKDWKVEDGGKNVWYPAPEMDIEAVPYIIFKDQVQTSKFVLQLNSPFAPGDLSSIVKDGTAGNNGSKVIVFGGIEYKISEIIGLISKVDLTDGDYTTVNTFTALTDVTLLKETSLPAGAFGSISTLKYLNLPLVSSVNSTALNNINNALEEVYMPSFNFSPLESKVVRDNVLKAASLKKTDVSGSDYIGLSYVQEKLSFEGFKLLEGAVIQNGVQLGEGAFKECEKLTDINFEVANPGFIPVANGAKVGNYIFEGCKVLTSIKLPDAMVVLSEGLFKDCEKLTTITGVDKVTTIMKGAFNNCKALVYINAANARVIEVDAFNGCRSLLANSATSTNGLTFPELTTLNERTFKGCEALLTVKLPKVSAVNCVNSADGVQSVTAADDAPFAGTTNLAEVECASIFTVNGVAAFKDTPTAVKLYVHRDQPGVGFDLKSFSWTNNSVSPAEKLTATFKAIARITY